MISLADDKLNREEFLNDLFNLFDNFGNFDDGGLTISINGKYGSGKSTLLNFIEEKNKDEQKYNIVRYDAWQNNLFDNPIIPILYSLNHLEKTKSKIKAGAKNIIKSLPKILVGTLANAHSVDFSSLFVNESIFEDYKKYSEAIAKYKLILTEFCKEKKTIMLIDELVNLYRIPTSVTRQYNYEKILMMYNDTLQGKAKYLGIIMGGTPQCVEDTRKGIFSYDALRSRLTEGKFASEDTVNLLSPIIRLKRLTPDEMFILTEKLRDIHSDLHEYKSELTQDDLMQFIKIEYERVGANTNITPREVIRDFIELLDILYQNPNKTFADIIGNEKFEFAKGDNTEEEENREFEDFEV